jgi:hypothetical protein
MKLATAIVGRQWAAGGANRARNRARCWRRRCFIELEVIVGPCDLDVSGFSVVVAQGCTSRQQDRYQQA